MNILQIRNKELRDLFLKHWELTEDEIDSNEGKLDIKAWEFFENDEYRLDDYVLEQYYDKNEIKILNDIGITDDLIAEMYERNSYYFIYKEDESTRIGFSFIINILVDENEYIANHRSINHINQVKLF